MRCLRSVHVLTTCIAILVDPAKLFPIVTSQYQISLLRFPHPKIIRRVVHIRTSPSVMATCFLPNGTADPKVTIRPCGGNTGMCCVLANQTPDMCEKDPNGQYTGLCLGRQTSNLWRDSCTDKNWGPSCLNICADDRMGQSQHAMALKHDCIVVEDSG